MPRDRKVRVGMFKQNGRPDRPAMFWSERDCNNQLRQYREVFETIKQAHEAANTKYREINSDSPTLKSKPTDWDTLVKDFLASKKRRNVEDSSVSDIENTFAVFTSICGKPNNLQFNQRLIDKFIDTRKEQTSRVGKDKKISPATINKDLRNLKSFIMWGKDMDYFKGRFRVYMLKVEPKPVRRLANEEVKTLITKCANPELRLGIIIAVYTGLRRGDVWDLTRGQFDATGACWRGVVEQKTSKTSDCIRMAPAAAREVKRYLDTTFGQPSDKLFKNPFPRYDWDDLRALAGNCKFHDLRRTCSSTLGGVSTSGWVATKQLNHSDPKTTDGYMNVDKELTEAHSKMPTTDWGLAG